MHAKEAAQKKARIERETQRRREEASKVQLAKVEETLISMTVMRVQKAGYIVSGQDGKVGKLARMLDRLEKATGVKPQVFRAEKHMIQISGWIVKQVIEKFY